MPGLEAFQSWFFVFLHVFKMKQVCNLYLQCSNKPLWDITVLERCLFYTLLISFRSAVKAQICKNNKNGIKNKTFFWERKLTMGMDAAHISRPSRSLPGWLTANAIKRGSLLYWATLFSLSATIMHGVAVFHQLPPSVLLAILLIIFTIIQAIATVAVVLLPTRFWLLTTGIISAVGLLVWLVAHMFGIPDGFALWRPETVALSDLYLPVMEGTSAIFFLCLWVRTWPLERGVPRIIVKILPLLVALGLVAWVAIHSLSLVVIALDAGPVASLENFFLLPVGILVILLLLRLIIQPLRVRTQGTWRTFLILVPALFVTSLLLGGGMVSAIDTPWLSPSTPISVPAGQTATLTYCNSVNGSPLAMDISEPPAQAARPAPMVIYIHGGETLQGSRVLLDGSEDGQYLNQLRLDLLQRGFIVGAIDYGLVPLYSSGTEVQSAKCAIRFLRAHARELSIDPLHIGVYGPSQGGYISTMLATLPSGTFYDTGQYLDQSSSVQAVVDMWGPTDLTNWSGSPWWVHLLGGNSTTAQLRYVSPLYHVAHGDPPFLIIQGTDDWFIAPHHSQDLAKRLQAAGVPVTLVMVQHEQHGLAVPTPGQVEQPAPATLIHMMRDFFVRTLAS
jgi:acetyl esterase/lipase